MLSFQPNVQVKTPKRKGSPLQRAQYFQRAKTQMIYDSEIDQKPMISLTSALSPLPKKDLSSTPVYCNTASTGDFVDYIKGTSGTPRRSDSSKKQTPRPKPFADLNEDDINEFSESLNSSFCQKSISEKVSTPNYEKKSMSDLTVKYTVHSANEKVSFFSRTNTESKENMVKLTRPSFRRAYTSMQDYEDEQPGVYAVNHTTAQNNQKQADALLLDNRILYEDFSNLVINYPAKERRLRLILTESGILERILQFLDFKDTLQTSSLIYEFRNNRQCRKIFQKRLYQFFSQGIEYKDQVYYWKSVVDFRLLKNQHPFAFTQHFAKECRYLEDIKKDLDRTLPEYDKYSTDQGKAALLSVLVAISNTVKDMGYIQGLNSIAGVFLFYLKEEESFWMMLYFMEKLKFKDLLKEDFKKVGLLNFQLQAYLQFYMPSLANHFKEHQMDISYFTTSWFLTLFSYHIDHKIVLKVWNILLTKGTSFLIQLALAIFSKFKEAIINMDIDEVGPFLKGELQNLSENDASLFKEALSFKMSKRILFQIEVRYKTGHSLVQIALDHTNKQQCIVTHSEQDKSPSRRDNRLRSKTESEETQAKENDIFHNLVNSFTHIPETIKSIFHIKDEIRHSSANKTRSPRNVIYHNKEDSIYCDDDKEEAQQAGFHIFEENKTKYAPTKPSSFINSSIQMDMYNITHSSNHEKSHRRFQTMANQDLSSHYYSSSAQNTMESDEESILKVENNRHCYKKSMYCTYENQKSFN